MKRLKEFVKLIYLIASLTSNGFAQMNNDNNRQTIYGHDTKDNYIVVGINGGYLTNAKKFSGELNAGGRMGDIYFAFYDVIPISFDALTPKVFGSQLGYDIGQFQVSVLYSYFTVGKEAEARLKGTDQEYKNGWKFGYGGSFYFKKFPIVLNYKRLDKNDCFSTGIYVTF